MSHSVIPWRCAAEWYVYKSTISLTKSKEHSAQSFSAIRSHVFFWSRLWQFLCLYMYIILKRFSVTLQSGSSVWVSLLLTFSRVLMFVRDSVDGENLGSKNRDGSNISRDPVVRKNHGMRRETREEHLGGDVCVCPPSFREIIHHI